MLARTMLCLSLILTVPALADERFIAIGTGGVTGVYYPTGSAICRLLNQGRDRHGIRCAVEPTGGSVDNIGAIRRGDVELGIVQADLHRQAFEGTGLFEGRAMPALRSILSLHSELFTLLVRADSGIEGFEDLRGARVNVGNPGSGQRATMERVMAAFGFSMTDFAQAAEYRGSEMARQICAGRIDALIYTVGHPNAAITEAAEACDVRLVPVTGPAVETLVAPGGDYHLAEVAAGIYPGTPGPTPTFAMRATLVATEDLPEEVAHAVARAVLSDLDTFRALHPAFADLTAEGMVTDGLTAPLHPGAVRAYRELGLMQ